MNIILENQAPIIEQNASFAKLVELLTRVSENPEYYLENEETLGEVVRTIYTAEVDKEIKSQLIENFIKLLGKKAKAIETVARLWEALNDRILLQNQEQQPQIIDATIIEKREDLPLAA